MVAVAGKRSDGDTRLRVSLAAESFEVRMPRPDPSKPFAVCAGTNDGAFSIQYGVDTDEDWEHAGCLLAPKTSSNPQYGNGILEVDSGTPDHNHNYGAFSQITRVGNVGSFLITQLGDKPVSTAKGSTIYLTIFSDANDNGKIDPFELELVELVFS